MRPTSTFSAEGLLNALLDRFECCNERVRDVTHTIDYRRVGGPAAQDDFHRVLRDAERSGCIALEENKFGRFTGELARVRLVNAGGLYTFLCRQPAVSVASTTARSVESAIPDILKEPFFKDVLKEASAAWAANKSFIGLTPAGIETFVTVLRLTHGIINLRGRDIDHRTFSRRAVKKSKALEQLEGRVTQLLKRWNPAFEGNEPREVLEACGVVRRAHLLLVKGPVVIESNDLKLQGTGQLFIGLPSTSIEHSTLNTSIEYIITIENPTSFWRYCMEVKGNYLALLTDGFPARDVLSSMVHLVTVARAIKEVPIFHWGDIDSGGVRIAAHLEDSFKMPLALHEMTPELAMKFGSPLQSRKGLERLKRRTGDIGDLARWLSGSQGLALEQEELDPHAPVVANHCL